MDIRDTLITLEEKFGPDSIVKDVEFERQCKLGMQYVLSDMLDHSVEQGVISPIQYCIKIEGVTAIIYRCDQYHYPMSEPVFKVYPPD